MYSYGNYYTWHAITADLTYSDINNDSFTNTSLCPTGWHLPTGGSVTDTVNVAENPSTWREYYNLGYAIMGSTTENYYSPITVNANGYNAIRAFMSFPNNFLYSGDISEATIYRRGREMSYWASTTESSKDAYVLRVNYHYADLSPGTSIEFKYTGLAVRCIIGP